MTERFHFEVDGEELTAVVYAATKPIGATLLLGPGASGGQRDRFIVDYATALAERGVLVVTYDFPFSAHGRRAPDPNEVLEECCRAAIVAAGQCRPKNRLFVGGKSLGGRVASEVVAAGGEEVDGVVGVVVLGYPLHAIGKPEAARTRHLPDLRVPALIVQGTRDAFGTADELRSVLDGLPEGSEIHAVDGGDHSFAVGRHGRSQGDVDASIHDEIARWISATASAPRRSAGAGRSSSRPSGAGQAASHLRRQLRAMRRQASS